jgi:glycosyltransferase involved in cell wall biosynthesis
VDSPTPASPVYELISVSSSIIVPSVGVHVDGLPKRILLFGYLPPPIFGPSVAYESLLESPFSDHFDVSFIDLSVVDSVKELESFRVTKLAKLLQFASLELWFLLTRRPVLCCYPISYNRNAFLKDAFILAFARAFRIPIVLWAHGVGLQKFRSELNGPLRRLFERMVRKSAGVVVPAECLRGEFEDLIHGNRIHVVTIGIQSCALPRAAPDDAAQTVLYLGTLLRAKGIFDLLEALPAIRASCPLARLVVAGDWFKDTEQAEARRYLSTHELDSVVEFVGPVHGRSKWQLLASVDVFVFPPHSEEEAFGIVLLEAMQAGLPIVTTVGGARDEIVTDGVHGFLAHERNPPDLAKQVVRLLTDPELRERMARANRQRFDLAFTSKAYGLRMIEVLERVMF